MTPTPWPHPPTVHDLSDLQHHLGHALGLVDMSAEQLMDTVPARDAEEGSIDEWRKSAATVVDLLDAHLARIKAALAEAGELLVRSYPYDPEDPLSMIDLGEGPLGPLPAFTPRWGGNRTEWSNDELRHDVLQAIVKRVVEDPEAMTGDPSDLAAATFEAVAAVVSVNGSNVKTGRKLAEGSTATPTGLRGLGLDPDDYSTKTKAPPTVTVNRG